MLRFILITMLIRGILSHKACPQQKVIAPHLGIGTCLFENNNCTSQILCVACHGVWTCQGVPDYHKILQIAGDTITLEIDDQQTLIVFVMFVAWCALEIYKY